MNGKNNNRHFAREFAQNDQSTRRWLCYTVLISLFACSATSATENSAPLPIQLRKVLLQELPREVASVKVGPDDRHWYEIRHDGTERSVTSVRQLIEDQFNSEEPQLAGIRPILFDPNGRIWFTTTEANLLLGFNGKDWVEYKSPPEHHFTGICPGHGHYEGRNENASYDGFCFFYDEYGIHVYGNGKWNYQQFLENTDKKSKRKNQLNQLRRLPDSRDLVLAITGDTPELWRWSNGEWQHLNHVFPKTHVLVPWTENQVWLCSSKGMLELHPLDVKQQATRFEKLLRSLKQADDETERNEICQKMFGLGKAALPSLEHAISTTYDVDLIESLIDLQRRLHAYSEQLILGDYTIDNPRFCHQDADGTLYIGSNHIKGVEEAGFAGVVIAGLHGDIRAFANNELFKEKWVSWRSTAIPARTGNAIWTSACSQTRLLDSSTGDFSARFPYKNFKYLHATDRAGRLFVSVSDGSKNNDIMVFTPDAPDDRRIVNTQRLRLHHNSGGDFGVSKDGTIWTVLADGKIVRFDGVEWRQVYVLKSTPRNVRFFPGNGDSVLILIDGTEALLFSRNRKYLAKDVYTLVQKQRELIAELFAPPGGASCQRIYFGIVVDSQKNIWLMKNRHLKVLAENGWIDARTALLNRKSRSGAIEYLTSVGNGSQVFVSDLLSPHEKGKSFWGQVVGEELVLTEASLSVEVTSKIVKSEDGVLWIPDFAYFLRDGEKGKVAHIISDNGDIKKIFNQGWAALIEDDGTVWLGDVPQKHGQFNLWRNGAIVGTTNVRYLGYHRFLFSDRPGSVFIWTLAGLQHFVRKPNSVPVQYRLEETIAVAGPDSNHLKTAVSRLGYLLTSSYVDAPSRSYHLDLIPIPELRRDTVSNTQLLNSGAQ